MKNELATTNKDLNHASIAIEQERAIAEAQGQLALAKKFPRDMNTAYAELMISCSYKGFAESAFYSVPNRGAGPSIRFAEEVARCYGNFIFGHKELSRSEGKSEIEVYAWDLEKNNKATRQITIMHIQDTKYGPKILDSQADIDNRIANVASKQMRGRILSLLPKWFISDAIEKCKNTLLGKGGEPIEVRIRKMVDQFQTVHGLQVDAIESYLGCKLKECNADHLFSLVGVWNSLKEGAKVNDFFGKKEVVISDLNIDDSSEVQKPVIKAEPVQKKAAEKKVEVVEKAEPKASVVIEPAKVAEPVLPVISANPKQEVKPEVKPTITPEAQPQEEIVQVNFDDDENLF